MRCKEVRQWMNASDGKPSPAIVRHIANCPSCARVAHADHSLNQLLSVLRQDEQVAPLAAFRRKVETAAVKQSALEKIMLRIKDQITLRPGLLAGASLAIAAFLFVTFVPFSFTHTAGYVVSVEDATADEQVTAADVEKAIEVAEVKDVSLVVARIGDINRYTIRSLPSLKIANRLALAIRQVADTGIELHIEPNIKVISGPLYAQVVTRVVKETDKPYRIKLELGELVVGEKGILKAVDDLALTDAEVEAIIRDKLIELGSPPDDITVSSKTDLDNNTRTIKLGIDSAVIGESESQMQFSIVDPADDYRYKEIAIKTRTGRGLEADSLGNVALKGHTIVIKFSLKDRDE